MGLRTALGLKRKIKVEAPYIATEAERMAAIRIAQINSILVTNNVAVPAEAYHLVGTATDLAVRLTHICIAAGIPLPPPEHLQQRVVGGYVPGFMWSGFRPMAEFDSLLMRHFGKHIGDFRRILDFGVGCGRVLRPIARTYPNVAMTGTDIDPEAIAWLATNYGEFGTFITAPHTPPIVLPGRSFDLIYAISVFTHLPEDMQWHWLSELVRLLDDNGIAIITVHGENYLKQFPEEQQAAAAASGGFLYNDAASETDGLPAFYKNSYHTETYVRSRWSEYFDIITYVPLGSEKHQDIILCRKR